MDQNPLSEAQLQKLQQEIGPAFLLITQQGEIVDASNPITDFIGQNADPLGIPWEDIVKFKEGHMAAIVSGLIQYAQATMNLVQPQEHYFLLETIALPIRLAFKAVKNAQNEKIIGIGFALASPALLLSEGAEIFELAADSTKDVVIISDIDEKESLPASVIYVNKAFEEMTGYATEDILGAKQDLLVGPKTSPETLSEIEKKQLLKEQIGPTEIQFHKKNGQSIWIELEIRPVLNAEGKLTHWISTLHDISLRKEALASTERADHRYKDIIQSIKAGVIETDVDGKVTFINGEGALITDWNRETVRGKDSNSIFMLVEREKHTPMKNPVEKVITTATPIEGGTEELLVDACGHYKCVSFRVTPLFDRDNKVRGSLIVFQEMAVGAFSESERLKMQKLQSVSLLAGGIAHDFKNMLTGIIGNISLATAQLDEGDRVYNILKSVQNVSTQASDLAAQLLSYAREGKQRTGTIDVSDLICEMSTFMLRGTSTRCDLNVADNLKVVNANKNQLSQVLCNLLINASQAQDNAGIVYVTAEKVVCDDEDSHPLGKGQYIKIEVKDEGSGIPPEILPKIFDPYFTTKEKGTGLGLASSHAIITQHNGHIFVESETDKGSKFTIFLPACPTSGQNQGSQNSEFISGSGGRILIMDDEPMIQQITGHMLEHLGFEVGYAKTGEKALELYANALKQKRPFKAVLMDLTIAGGMGAEEAIQLLLEEDPKAKVILSSGYVTHPVIKEYKEHGFKECLLKPYTIQQLNNTLVKLMPEKSKSTA